MVDERSNSWTEYRRLVLQNLEELKSDMDHVQARLANLEKYADLKDQVEDFVSDFNEFARNYEKDMATVKTKQALLYSGLAAFVSVLISFLTS